MEGVLIPLFSVSVGYWPVGWMGNWAAHRKEGNNNNERERESLERNEQKGVDRIENIQKIKKDSRKKGKKTRFSLNCGVHTTTHSQREETWTWNSLSFLLLFSKSLAVPTNCRAFSA